MASARMLDPALGASLIEAAGTDALPPLLLDAAHWIAGVDEIFAYRARADDAPDILLSASRLDDAAARAANYVRGFFRFDPVTRLRRGTNEAFVARVSADELTQARYRSLCFESPRFAEKLCFGWREGANSLVLSFYRSHAAGLADEEGLAPLANIALSILAKQGRPQQPLVGRLERKLTHCFPQLTRREREVAARTIAGWTAEQTAEDLNIRPATVLTYRQRAYARLGFRSAQDFLRELLH